MKRTSIATKILYPAPRRGLRIVLDWYFTGRFGGVDKKKPPRNPKRSLHHTTRLWRNDTNGTFLLLSLHTRRRRDYLIPYFRLNLSTRPAVSTSFCLPVKNGWHWEQISTSISFEVDLVTISFPHAHRIVVSSYLGCIPFFIPYPPIALY